MRFDMLFINIVFATIGGLILVLYMNWNRDYIEQSRKILFVIVFGLFNGLLSTLASTKGDLIYTIKPLLILIVGIIIIKFLLGFKWLKSISLYCLYLLGLGVSSAIWSLFVGLFITKDIKAIEMTSAPFYLLSNAVVAGLTFPMLVAVKKTWKTLKQISNNKELSIGLILTILIVTANAGLYYYVKVFNFTAFFVITILTILYCAFIVFYSTTLYMQKLEREQQEFYNHSLEDTLFNMRRFKHDWNNNLSTLNAMIAMNKFTEAKQYLKELTEYNEVHNDTSFLNIKNAGLYGIFSSKLATAQEKGIGFNIVGSGEIRSIPGIKISELCEIIGILLDNAIEESVKLNENIEIRYSNTDTVIEFCIMNKCVHDIDISKFGKVSEKGQDHGSGLKIIDQIVEKYKHIKNYRSYENDTKIFEQTIVIEKGL